MTTEELTVQLLITHQAATDVLEKIVADGKADREQLLTLLRRYQLAVCSVQELHNRVSGFEPPKIGG
jgi:hypothetical protein